MADLSVEGGVDGLYVNVKIFNAEGAEKNLNRARREIRDLNRNAIEVTLGELICVGHDLMSLRVSDFNYRDRAFGIGVGRNRPKAVVHDRLLTCIS